MPDSAVTDALSISGVWSEEASVSSYSEETPLIDVYESINARRGGNIAVYKASLCNDIEAKYLL